MGERWLKYGDVRFGWDEFDANQYDVIQHNLFSFHTRLMPKIIMLKPSINPSKIALCVCVCILKHLNLMWSTIISLLFSWQLQMITCDYQFKNIYKNKPSFENDSKSRFLFYCSRCTEKQCTRLVKNFSLKCMWTINSKFSNITIASSRSRTFQVQHTLCSLHDIEKYCTALRHILLFSNIGGRWR